MLASLLFAIPLFLIAVGMLIWHYRRWAHLQSKELGEYEHDFYRRQFRRRMQGSSMIAIVAVMVVSGNWIGDEGLAAIHWGIVLLLVFWMVAMALMDGIASRGFFETELNRNLKIQETLQTEIKRYRNESRDGNGEMNPDDPHPGEA